MWAVIRPVQAVTEDIFIRICEATAQCELLLTVSTRQPHVRLSCSDGNHAYKLTM